MEKIKDNDMMIEQDGRSLKVGELRDKGKVFYKTVTGSKHLYRSIGDKGAWGIDAAWYKLVARKLEKIIIFDIESRTMYTVENNLFDTHSQYLHFKPYRPQRFLKLEFWSERKL